ncbi:SurE domain-containing protein [Gluconacetobacter diazotrophicus]|uniref:hypothetical protein n=1 Tax=Gluconacetobacter diazotrophicus TaxID=33996 RepID=UPI000173CAD3|nr:hypothetical protein [Gluconacetobacter diazotrophicus]TWB07917.1 hypothetical protein FBZ86_109107 [Gluconacetobacter diazotrophicus]
MRWDTARTLAAGVIRRMLPLDWATGACLNVNFPDCPAGQAGAPILTSQGTGLLDGADILPRTDPRNGQDHWLTLTRSPRADEAGTETAALAAGHIAVTPLRFERTDDAVLARMRARWDSAPRP